MASKGQEIMDEDRLSDRGEKTQNSSGDTVVSRDKLSAKLHVSRHGSAKETLLKLPKLVLCVLVEPVSRWSHSQCPLTTENERRRSEQESTDQYLRM